MTKSELTFRLDKGSPLTWSEVDSNFDRLMYYSGDHPGTGVSAVPQEVYRYNGETWLCIQATGTAPVDGPDWVALSDDTAMRWKNLWISGDEYEKNDVVRDGDWTMIANKTTSEKPAPEAVGDPVYIYDGSGPTDSNTAKQLIQGASYTALVDVYINSYRVYTVLGNNYAVYSILPNGQINPLITFDATSTGWQNFVISPQLVLEGTTFQLVSRTTEPDPTVTPWTGDWNYTTPNNEGDPIAGQALHANRGIGTIRFHKTDSNGGDRSAELLAIGVGDEIEGPGITWAVQTVIDGGAYVEFAVAPQIQGSPAGVTTFTFNTVQPVPITYLKDVDFWLARPNIEGLEGIDVPLEDIVPDDNAYGVDLEVQEASISDDWDVVAVSSGSGAAGSSGETPTPGSWGHGEIKSVSPEAYGTIGSTGFTAVNRWDNEKGTAVGCTVDWTTGQFTFGAEGFWQVKLKVAMELGTGIPASRFLEVQVRNIDKGIMYELQLFGGDQSTTRLNVDYDSLLEIPANEVGDSFQVEWQARGSQLDSVVAANSLLRIESKFA